MTLYAWKTTKPPTPERAALGCPTTGWIHEGSPPWRVIVFPDLATAEKSASDERVPAEYTGTEDTVAWADYIPPAVGDYAACGECSRSIEYDGKRWRARADHEHTPRPGSR